mmetsp:Transcript_13471/g.28924  ORF Transcript_13471/g.28924 Transcript_13471/m.28924 type:complete len:96 (-) Transcript_13471:165-452(-)
MEEFQMNFGKTFGTACYLASSASFTFCLNHLRFGHFLGRRTILFTTVFVGTFAQRGPESFNCFILHRQWEQHFQKVCYDAFAAQWVTTLRWGCNE